MSRIAPAIPVSAKMYRHFAVVTLAITVCLAIFANGENRRAIADEVASKNREQAAAAKERELAKQGKGGNSKLVMKDKRRIKGSFGDDGVSSPTVTSYSGGSADFDDDGDFGYAAAPDQQGDYVQSASAEDIVIPSSPPPGMTAEEFEEMKRDLMRRKKMAIR